MHPSCGVRTPSRSVNAARFLAITEEVQARLSLICADMSTPLFNDMVARIARVQLTFEKNDDPRANVGESGFVGRIKQ